MEASFLFNLMLMPPYVHLLSYNIKVKMTRKLLNPLISAQLQVNKLIKEEQDNRDGIYTSLLEGIGLRTKATTLEKARQKVQDAIKSGNEQEKMEALQKSRIKIYSVYKHSSFFYYSIKMNINLTFFNICIICLDCFFYNSECEVIPWYI